MLDTRIRNCSSISKFNKNLISNIRPYTCIRLLKRFHLQFSDLNKHRFRHAFHCFTRVCICGLPNEHNEHFLLHFPQYHPFRLHLFGQISDIPEINLTSIDYTPLCSLLLYGNPRFDVLKNSDIIEATNSYIKKRVGLIRDNEYCSTSSLFVITPIYHCMYQARCRVGLFEILFKYYI